LVATVSTILIAENLQEEIPELKKRLRQIIEEFSKP